MASGKIFNRHLILAVGANLYLSADSDIYCGTTKVFDAATQTFTGTIAAAAGSIGTAEIADGAITAAKVVESQSVTSTADGTGSGAITTPTALKKFVTVTSAAATNQVSLPGINGSTLGQEIILSVGANGYELITPASSNATINQVDSDGTNQLDVAANTTLRVTCLSSTAWLAEQIAATAITVVAPDND